MIQDPQCRLTACKERDNVIVGREGRHGNAGPHARRGEGRSGSPPVRELSVGLKSTRILANAATGLVISVALKSRLRPGAPQASPVASAPGGTSRAERGSGELGLAAD